MSYTDVLLNLLKSTWEAIMLNGAIFCAIVLSMVISLGQSLKKRKTLDWIEAIICAGLTVGIACSLEFFNISKNLAIGVGALVGFKGSLWVDRKFTDWFEAKQGKE